MNEVVETWNSIIEKYQEAKNGTLKAEELIVFRVFAFLIRVEMNDVSGALYNLSPKLGSDQSSWNDLRATANAVNSIGDNQSAQLLLEAADIFEKLPEPLPPTWEEFVNLATPQLSEDFWQRIDSRISNIYDSLETYTVAHLLSQNHR